MYHLVASIYGCVFDGGHGLDWVMVRSVRVKGQGGDNGQRVDAEGSTSGMTALEIASVWQRLGAWFGGWCNRDSGRSGWWVVESALGDDGQLLIYVPIVFYFVVNLWLVSIRGQSLGKMAIGIKIVKTDGSSVGGLKVRSSGRSSGSWFVVDLLSGLHLDPVRW